VRFRRPVLHVQVGTRREKTFGQQAGLLRACESHAVSPESVHVPRTVKSKKRTRITVACGVPFFDALIFSPLPFAMKKAFSSRLRSDFFEQYKGVEGHFLGKFCAHISAPPPNSFAHSSPHGAIPKASPTRTGRHSPGEDIWSVSQPVAGAEAAPTSPLLSLCVPSPICSKASTDVGASQQHAAVARGGGMRTSSVE